MSDFQPSISVVIPVLNAEAFLPELLAAIDSQKPSPPEEIILVDSMSTDRTRAIAEKHQSVKIIEIRDFSHGRSRNMGARAAKGDIVALMTQDALPADDSWLAELVTPLKDPEVAAAYSRQMPRPGAPPTERFFLSYHFPDADSVVRKKTGDEPLTLSQVFFSNVSAAIRRETLLEHPFDENLIMSEDQQFARDTIDAGYRVVYAADSRVIHSHKYSLITAFRRYFDSVYSLTVIFKNHDLKTSGSMGLRYLRREFLYMLRKHPWYLPYYFLYTVAKTCGTIAGHFADRMPVSLVKRLSLHDYHWK